MRVSIILLGIYFSFFWEANAQSKVNFMEANLTLVQPKGHFGRNIHDSTLGFEFGYLRQFKKDAPLFWGISIYYTALASNNATFQELVDFQIFDFDYTTTSNLLGFHGKVRMYPDIQLWKIEPYIEAQIGYKWLFTNTSKTIVDDTASSDLNTEKGSLSLTYGVSVGLNIPINQHTFLNLRGNYLPGLSIPYYAFNPVNILQTTTLDGYDLKRSTTDIVRWDAGITYSF